MVLLAQLSQSPSASLRRIAQFQEILPQSVDEPFCTVFRF
jgi:hypothetical protein